MTDIIEVIETEIDVNGTAVPATITVSVTEDDTDPAGDFDFGDADENAEYLARFQSGELFMGLIKVSATALGEECIEYLGSCHLRSGDEEAVKTYAREYQMIDAVIKELTDTVQQLMSTQRLGSEG